MQKVNKDNWIAKSAFDDIETQHHRQNEGFLGSFLSKGLKTNQLVVNTDEKTLRPIARLKEPRDLFALPKDKDNDCSQQAPRWPVECQVIEERITHIPYVPAQPEPLNMPTGNELKPRPVGEENGIVVFTYSPISAVNYGKGKEKRDDESSDESDDSSDSHNESTPCSGATPTMQGNRTGGGGGTGAGGGAKRAPLKHTVTKMISNLDNRSTSNSQDEDNDNDNDDDYDDDEFDDEFEDDHLTEEREKAMIKDLIEAKKKRYDAEAAAEAAAVGATVAGTAANEGSTSTEIEDIWKNSTPEYKPASPHYILSQFGKTVPKVVISKLIDQSTAEPTTMTTTKSSNTIKVSNNKYAVQPIKFPKSIAKRLEQAFEIQSTKTPIDNQNANHNDDDGSDSDSAITTSDTGEGDGDCNCDEEMTNNTNMNRLAGGADSVSDTETLVGSNRQTETDHELGNEADADVGEVNVKRYNNPRAIHAATLAAATWAARQRTRGTYDMYHDQSKVGGSINISTLTLQQQQQRRLQQQVQMQFHQMHHTNRSNEQPFININNSSDNNNCNNNDDTNDETLSQSICSDTTTTQFSRSAVGGAKFVTNCHPMNAEEYDGLEFESRFESGNLAKAVQITPTYYELYLRPDLYTSRSKQWFYFRVRRTHRNMLYRFSIVNLVKSDSLYNDGMRPVMYSTLGAKQRNEGWRRCGDNICYYRNDDDNGSNANEEDEDNSSYTLTFTIEFEFDDDTVYFAHSYPYTYSDLQDYLMEIQRHPIKSKFCKLRLLCRTLAGNNVYYLTVTAPSATEENMRRKKSIVVSARVHPSETPSSWMMKGLMDFITGDTTVAKRLRHKFIFKLVPMLNPDGVIVGNTRNSLTGKDLNRQYRTVIRETYPSIWYTKAMIRRLIEECGVAMYCDMHAHSRKHNIFIYGCENKRNPEKKLTEQVFPLMLHKNSADRFSFESCKFKIQRSKEGTGRIVVWMLGITNSYTIEASFGGSSLGSRKGTHFNTQDYEHMGRAFCETLLDYCDENPNKVKRQAKLYKQIKKIRKREKREQKALKLQKLADQGRIINDKLKILNLLKQQDRLRSKIIERLMREGSSADEPLNIPLSDYSSDEGNCSSSSDNEGKHSITASDLEGPCCAPVRAPPSSPEVMHEIRKFRMRRMRKVMHELDRIYFTPLFQRKFKTLTQLKRRRHKIGVKVPPKRLRGGATVDVEVETNRETAAMRQRLLKPTTTTTKATTKTTTDPKPPTSHETENGESKLAGKKRSKGGGNPTTVATTSVGNGSNVKKLKKKPGEKSSKAQAQATPQKIQIDRTFRLWLAHRKIFICRRKKTRRLRVRTKPTKKRTEIQRTTLDLPTTDPGSDLHFSTDDEEHAPAVGGSVPPLRHTLLQSDLQRRYIEEIGDTVVQKPKPAAMPPELIVTTPSKSSNGKKLDVYKLTPSTAPEQQNHSQDGGSLSALSGSGSGGGGGNGGGVSNNPNTRRTYSWHNLNQEQAKQVYNYVQMSGDNKPATKSSHKALPRRNFMSPKPSHDELQLKLSLKKKIWTGAQAENEGRPLAAAAAHWYKGSNFQANMAVAAAAAAVRSSGGGVTRALHTGGGSSAKETPLIASSSSAHHQQQLLQPPPPPPPPVFVGNARRTKKMEQVDLLNACTHKLLLWQQEEQKKQQPQQRSMGGGGGGGGGTTTNVTKLEEQQTAVMRCYKATPNNKRSNNQLKSVVVTTTVGSAMGIAVSGGEITTTTTTTTSGKGKRRSNSMLKLAETTQLVTRFARPRNNNNSNNNSSSNICASAGAHHHHQHTHNQHQQHHATHSHQLAAQRLMLKNSVASTGGGQQQQQQQQQHQQLSSNSRAPPNKFKTSGLVVTAVQQSSSGGGHQMNYHGSRKLRANGTATTANAIPLKSSSAAAAAASSLLQYRTSANHPQHQGGNNKQPPSSVGVGIGVGVGMNLDTVNLVRKVKTKLKKRKSRTIANNNATTGK